jgi:hypothetical protein
MDSKGGCLNRQRDDAQAIAAFCYRDRASSGLDLLLRGLSQSFSSFASKGFDISAASLRDSARRYRSPHQAPSWLPAGRNKPVGEEVFILAGAGCLDRL